MIHINKFIDKLKFFESRNSKDFIIPLSDAKDLHNDITKLLLLLHTLDESKEKENPHSVGGINGGDW